MSHFQAKQGHPLAFQVAQNVPISSGIWGLGVRNNLPQGLAPLPTQRVPLCTILRSQLLADRS